MRLCCCFFISVFSWFFFFFQAEDGIRDKLVTGVQTCALPISTETEIACFAGAMEGFGSGWGAGFAIMDDILKELQG